MRVLFAENTDSFSWNVIDCLPASRAEIEIISGATLARELHRLNDIDVLVVGPGPMDPERVGLVALIQEAARRDVAVLGVCLGHQAIGLAFGATLERTPPAHGKQALVHFSPSRCFPGIEGARVVMRYHSLSLTEISTPLRIVARTSDGLPMAIEHETLPIAGLQFHPDSYGSPDGAAFFAAFFRSLGLTHPEAATVPPQVAPQLAPSPSATQVPSLNQPPSFAQSPLTLNTLNAQGTFALLAPGFAGGHWTLLDELTACPPEDAQLLFAPFETQIPQGYRGRVWRLSGPPRFSDETEHGSKSSFRDVDIQEESFPEAVETIRDAIEAGDVYQVCLTRSAPLKAETDGPSLFSALCARGTPTYAAWVRLPDGVEIVSGSPELLFDLQGGRVHSSPMKGTSTPEAEETLRQSEKDQAELAMITDLIRDDLTPLCLPGTVEVPEARRFIRLPYAIQTVSDVVGTLRDGLGPTDVLAALQPGGSVTGAPRPAALEMIGRLESAPRGAYCGALGLVEGDHAVVSLLIRTAELRGQRWIYGVGAGIVYDSDPAQELRELHTKLRAIGCASPP